MNAVGEVRQITPNDAGASASAGGAGGVAAGSDRLRAGRQPDQAGAVRRGAARRGDAASCSGGGGGRVLGMLDVEPLRSICGGSPPPPREQFE